MDLRAINEIKYLKVNRPLLLLEFLKVLDGIKPGLFIESSDHELLKNLTSLCKRFGLFLSFKSGGYITKDWFLYKDWELTIDPIIVDATKFIGYPACCVNAFSKSVTINLVRELYWYYVLMTRSIDELINYARECSYVEHYPCCLSCAETRKQSIEYRKLIRHYSFVLPANIERVLYSKRVGSIKRIAKSIIYAADNGLFRKLGTPQQVYNELKKQGVVKAFGLGRDFVKIVSDLFTSKVNKKFTDTVQQLH
jgi:hypothetical protein